MGRKDDVKMGITETTLNHNDGIDHCNITGRINSMKGRVPSYFDSKMIHTRDLSLAMIEFHCRNSLLMELVKRKSESPAQQF